MMKKLLLIVFVSLFAFGVSQAQVIETGDQVASVGIGIGGSMVSGDGFPAITFSYETLPFEKMGIGYVSLGGYGAYKHSSYDYSWGTSHKSEINYNYWVFGARGAYHFDFYDMNGQEFFEKFDVYAGVFLGFSYDAVNYNGNDEGTFLEDTFENELSFRNDLFVGCRYEFSETFGVFAEAGYSVSNLSAGISFLF